METRIRFKSLWGVVGVLLAVIVLGFGMLTFGNKDIVQEIFTWDAIETPRTEQPLGLASSFYERKQIKVQEESRSHVFTYFWLEPHKPYPEGLKFPLVVVLHGAPGNAYAGEYIAQNNMQYAYPSFVMVPVIPAGTAWSYPATFSPEHKHMESLSQTRQMLPYLISMIKDVMAQYPIDSSRIYILGCSDGGFGAFGAARHYPDLFAAAVSISGGWTVDDAPNLTKVPLWVIHGRQDEVIPVTLSRDVSKLIQQYGGPARYTEIADMGHNCPAPQLYGKALWNWMFRQKKESPGKI